MALAYRTSAVGGNTISGTGPSATITSAIGDLFLVFCQAVGNTNTSPTCSDDGAGGTYALLFTAQSTSGLNTLSCFVRNNILASAVSVTVTVACGAHVASEMCVVALSGGTVAGTAAVIQTGTQANQAASTTPAPGLTNTPLIGDIILSAVGSVTDPTGVAVSANTSIWTWTLAQDVGQTGCGLAVEYSTGVVGPLPSSAVTWGSTSASAFASCAVELAAPPSTTGVNVSKLNSYGVLAPPIGVDVSKLISYGALTPPIGVDVSKLISYGALTYPQGVNTSKLITYAVLAAIQSPIWPSISPPTGYVGNPYFFGWDLSPASAPTTYSLFSGSLPPGLSLNSPSADLGNVSGTPTTVGTYSFVVTATNAYGSANQPMTIVISFPSGVGGSFVFIG